MADRTAREDGGWLWLGASHRLQLETLAGADPLSRSWGFADLQQPGGKFHQADHAGAPQLVIHRFRAGRPQSCRDPEFARHRKSQWFGALRLAQGHPRKTPHLAL